MIAASKRKRKQEIVEVRTLCAIVRCGALAVAIPADAITFIANAEDTRLVAHDGGVRVVAGEFEAEGALLHQLLGIPGEATSWLFLRSSGAGAGSAALALGCGDCMTVTKLLDPDLLPRGIFQAGGTAIVGAFPVDDALRERGCMVAGIWLDPARLVLSRPA